MTPFLSLLPLWPAWAVLVLITIVSTREVLDRWIARSTGVRGGE